MLHFAHSFELPTTLPTPTSSAFLVELSPFASEILSTLICLFLARQVMFNASVQAPPCPCQPRANFASSRLRKVRVSARSIYAF